MGAANKRMVSLPREQADYVDDLVASGAYANDSEVVCAALQALQECENDVERWLREEVVPVAAAMRSDPGRAIPIDRAFGEIRALHARRLKTSGRAS